MRRRSPPRPLRRRRLGGLGAALALCGALAAGATAQETAQLAADSLRLESGNRLVAEGSVEVLWRGSRLRASRLVYTRGLGQAPDRLEIVGPILLEDGPDAIILAEAAELSADLRDGLLRGARLVLDRRLQLAATEVRREGGRFTRLERAVASSCQICPSRPVPLWEIRAARVTHDSETRQLLFERAAFRISGRTVAVLPRLRMPDPTVSRMSGFLAPEFASTSVLGFGLRLPYFLVLGEDRDLTVTPRLNLRGSATLEMRYRQAFSRGEIELWGALTRDRLPADQPRGLLRASADYRLTADTVAGVRLRQPSDRTYAGDYGFGGGQKREARLFVEQARRDALGRAELLNQRPDRGDQPTERIASATLNRRFPVPGLGGTGQVMLDGLVLSRDATPGAQAGVELARLSARVDWRRDWLLKNGLLVGALAEVQADQWHLRNPADGPRNPGRISPALGLELRWPWVRHNREGVRHVIEPVAQFVLARPHLPDVPNEDSLLVEFDEASLLQLQRAPGFDLREPGTVANLGVSWTRHDPTGWALTLTGGRVLRNRPADFTASSGLAGRRSAWLAAATLVTSGGVAVAGRALIDSDGSVPRHELRFGYLGDGLQLAGAFVHLEADPAEGRSTRTTELDLDGALQLDDNWTALAELRFDIARREPGRLGLGARFRNECLAVDVSLSRRFVSSTSVSAQTEFGLTVDLIGFGDRPGGAARPCGR